MSNVKQVDGSKKFRWGRGFQECQAQGRVEKVLLGGGCAHARMSAYAHSYENFRPNGLATVRMVGDHRQKDS